MEFQKNKFHFLLIILLISNSELAKIDNVNNITNINHIIQSPSSKYSGFLRKLWNEDVQYGRVGVNDEEKESLKHCDNSDYKYKSYFAYGQNYEFIQNNTLNIYNAVSIY